jgi:hypothetical protein
MESRPASPCLWLLPVAGWLGWAIKEESFVVGFAAAGDTNLDGLVDVVDMNTILSQMSGDADAPVTWNAGDFNHDDTSDVMDLVDLFGGGVLDADTYLPAPPPASPRNLLALPLSTTSITLSWTTDDAPAGYEIERSADGITEWQPVAPGTIQITGTSATISGFEPGERASFRVRAFAESPSWWWDDRYRSADTAATDTDGDGVGDYAETQQGSNPTGSGSLAPDPVARANPPAWAAELSRDDGVPRSTEVVILPSEITLPAPILVQWYGGPIALGGGSGGSGAVGDRGIKVVSIATRWIIVDLYRADVPFEKANGGVSLTYLAIDVDVDSDNTGRVERSAWEEALEEERYGLGALIMLANSPFRPVTDLVIDVPRPIMTVYGLPANEAGEVGLRFDWNPAGKAGSIMLWNTMVPPAARNPAPLDQGGNRIEPGKFYPLYMFRDDMMVFVEGVDENVGLKTLAGVEGEGKPEEYIRATFIVKGQDVGSDQVKYLVANEDSFFYQLQTRQEVRNALASRGVYTFADLKNFCLQPKSPLDLLRLGVPNNANLKLGEGSGIAGFKAMVYQDYITGERQYVLVFGGTDDNFVQFLDWLSSGAEGDWKTNFDQGLGRGTPPPYEAAMKIGDGLSESRGIPAGHLIVTGHSLGGGLASAAAVVGGFRADTFNAAWLRQETLLEPDSFGGTRERYPGSLVNFAAAAGAINAYNVDWDILTYFQTQFQRLLDPTIAPVGLRHELDGPHDYDLVMADSIPLASLSVMAELHKTSSILYGLLVAEDWLGVITIDLLGYPYVP